MLSETGVTCLVDLCEPLTRVNWTWVCQCAPLMHVNWAWVCQCAPLTHANWAWVCQCAPLTHANWAWVCQCAPLTHVNWAWVCQCAPLTHANWAWVYQCAPLTSVIWNTCQSGTLHWKVFSISTPRLRLRTLRKLLGLGEPRVFPADALIDKLSASTEAQKPQSSEPPIIPFTLTQVKSIFSVRN